MWPQFQYQTSGLSKITQAFYLVDTVQKYEKMHVNPFLFIHKNKCKECPVLVLFWQSYLWEGEMLKQYPYMTMPSTDYWAQVWINIKLGFPYRKKSAVWCNFAQSGLLNLKTCDINVTHLISHNSIQLNLFCSYIHFWLKCFQSPFNSDWFFFQPCCDITSVTCTGNQSR